MGGQDDRHWKTVEAERAAHRARHGEERAGATDPGWLHPGNEGQDEARRRVELEGWAAEADAGGRAARALRRLGPTRGAVEGGPAAEALGAGGAEPPPQRPPERAHGGHTRGGEPRKPARPPADTSPAPGAGPRDSSAAPGEPPAITVTAAGVRYDPGEQRAPKTAAEVTKARRARARAKDSGS